MTLLDKFRIRFFPLMNSSYSKEADKTINSLIDHGTIIGSSPFEISIEYGGMVFQVWATNKYYADLDRVICIDNSSGEPIRRVVSNWVRPSRKTKLRFWKWVESIDSKVFHNEENGYYLIKGGDSYGS